MEHRKGLNYLEGDWEVLLCVRERKEQKGTKILQFPSYNLYVWLEFALS